MVNGFWRNSMNSTATCGKLKAWKLAPTRGGSRRRSYFCEPLQRSVRRISMRRLRRLAAALLPSSIG